MSTRPQTSTTDIPVTSQWSRPSTSSLADSRRRFSKAERLAFGAGSLSRCSRAASIARFRVGLEICCHKGDVEDNISETSTAVPTMKAESCERSVASCSTTRPLTPEGGLEGSEATTAFNTFDAAQLRYVLNRLIPVEDSHGQSQGQSHVSVQHKVKRLSLARSASSPGLPRAPAPDGLPVSLPAVNAWRTQRRLSALTGASGVAGVTEVSGDAGVKAAVPSPFERLRRELVLQGRCMHQAFALMERRTLREQPLSLSAFKQTLTKAGASEELSTEIFTLLQAMKRPKAVSLQSLKEAMIAAVPPEVLLREARRHLAQQGIRPGDTEKALQRIRPRQAKGKAEIEEVQVQEACLGRKEWHKFCTSIGLTVQEANRLLPIFARGSNCVDINDMFEKLRQALAPEVTLQRFASKLLHRYGDFAAAFQAVARDDGMGPEGPKGQLIRWPEFQPIAVDINDQSRMSIWQLLARGDESRQVSETTFLEQLSSWAPGTALSSLQGQIQELFQSLSDFRRELKGKTGLSDWQQLPPELLHASLVALGLSLDLDASDRIIETIQTKTGRAVTFDDFITALKPAAGKNQSTASAAVTEDMLPLWRSLQELQEGLLQKR